MPKEESAFELWLPPRPDGAALQHWLYEGVRQAILEGRLRAGQRVPATRRLAAEYGVSRGSVTAAYDQLVAEGYLTARVGAGTRVNAVIPDGLLGRQPPAPAMPRGREAADSPPSGPVPARTGQPFTPHRPALDLFPKRLWGQMLSRQLRQSSPATLAEGEAFGYRPLRDAIARYVGTARGVVCGPHRVMVVSGLQQALDLTVRALLGPDDVAWMEDPGYARALSVMKAAGVGHRAVPVDSDGLDAAHGERVCPDARLAYVTPAHQAPLGVAMTLPRRMRLLDWARRANAWIFEDDYDSEYRYRGKPLPSLCALQRDPRVLHFGSFSKTLFPGLRLGYLVLPESLIEPFAEARAITDRFPSILHQLALAEFMERGHYARHLRRMRKRYAQRREALAKVVGNELRGILRFVDVPAGLDAPAWIETGIEEAALIDLAGTRGIHLSGLGNYAVERPLAPGVLLGFAATPGGELERAGKTLARALLDGR